MSTNRMVDLLKQLSNTGDSVVISYSNGNTISFNQSRSASSLKIGKHTVSLDDPNAAEKLSLEDRKMFWSICSEEAKNSELYRKYAIDLLTQAGVDLRTISSDQMKNFFITNADGVAKLSQYFTKQNIHNWLDLFAKLPNNQYELFISRASDTEKLLKGLSSLNYPTPLSILCNIDANYLNLLITNTYDFIEFSKALNLLGYKDPLAQCISLTIPKLTYFLAHRYDIIELQKSLLSLGYNNPWQTLVEMNSIHLDLLLAHRYDSTELLKTFKSKYQDPLSTLLSINPEKLNQLFANRYDSTELMKLFTKLKYPDPLQALLSIDTVTINIFYRNRYNATQIMQALYETGIKNPINYLIDLGNQAILTILNNQSEYVNRIKRGIDISQEFKPSKPVEDELRPELKKFVADYQGKESNDLLAAMLAISEEKLADCLDAATNKTVNIPVRLDGDLFDFKTLLNLPKDAAGKRKHPISNDPFSLSDLQPAKDIQKKFDKIVEAHLANNENQPRFRM